MIKNNFFERDTCTVARSLLGKVIRHNYQGKWLSAVIIETEAYYLDEKGSHSSLGLTLRTKPMFMPAGTIYMYYARGRDSLNISCIGDGNAVLIKSAYPWFDEKSPIANLEIMQENNLLKGQRREVSKLCKGQTLLCSALGLKVKDWNQKKFTKDKFYIEDAGQTPDEIIQTTRLGIPKGRDEHLPYRFIHADYLEYCTKKPSVV